MTSTDDDRLRDAFGALRGTREAQAGDFRATAVAATSRARRGEPLVAGPVAVAAAMALLVAAAVVGQQRATARTAAAVAAQASPLAAWRSPTGWLLETPHADWMRAAPALHTSIINVPLTPSGGPQ